MSSEIAAAIVSAVISASGQNVPVTVNDVTCMAENIYHEAREVDVDGQIMVAHVVINRVEKRNKTICEVIHEKNQFSWVSSSPKINFDDPIEAEAFSEAVNVAIEVISGFHTDLDSDADHYFNPAKLEVIPVWAKKMEFVGAYGKHHFYIDRSS